MNEISVSMKYPLLQEIFAKFALKATENLKLLPIKLPKPLHYAPFYRLGMTWKILKTSCQLKTNHLN